ncbi:transcriptional regulator, CdaR [Thermobaculum terrenum ATCC BAA-798]|uniref:Transcriptional regulator, CdaR n=2 Tax=Thermobaculum TaxID=262406 RepID=D1CDQ9_THET1|nr:transcriptional regulator, CdaR [Thermobaculum terrenum ATCC BAA-798]
MGMEQDYFREVANTVVKKIGSLLDQQVIVADDRGWVIASTDRRFMGKNLDTSPSRRMLHQLRVPIKIRDKCGQLMIIESNKPSVPPRMAEALVEMVINQIMLVESLPNQSDLKNKLIYDLLHGNSSDETSIIRQAQILGMDLNLPRAVLLIDASKYILGGDDRQLQQKVNTIIRSIVDFFMLPSDTICGYIGEGEVVVLKASSSRDLANWLRPKEKLDTSPSSWANLAALKRAANALLSKLRSETKQPITIGIGRYHPGILGLTASYQDARAALSLGLKFYGPNKVHCLDSLGIPAFVGISDERTKNDLATHLLKPLEKYPELMQTLEVFFDENCCPTSASKKLCIHRNTLTYRLDKIASLTGLDPRDFDSAVQLRLALTLKASSRNE